MILDKDESRWLTLLGKQLVCDVYRLKIVSVYKHWAYGVKKFGDSVGISFDMEAEVGKIF